MFDFSLLRIIDYKCIKLVYQTQRQTKCSVMETTEKVTDQFSNLLPSKTISRPMTEMKSSC